MRLLRGLTLMALIVACAAGSGVISPAAAEKRVALVVGNSAYRNIPALANPRNDARLIADTLKSLGFAIVGGGPQLDLDVDGLRRAVRDFGNALDGAEVAMFYFAGHGVAVRNTNFLAPVEANPVREADVDLQMLDANVVLRQMEGSGARLNLVILDACRNNPFAGRGLRSTSSGLAQMQATEGTLISFATQPGNVALDGAGANSPYAKALADTIRRPGLGLFDAFNEVGLAVKEATAGAQQPWVSSSPIRGSFFFAGLPATTPGAARPAPQNAPALAADEVFWLAIRDSKLAALFQEFLNKYPASPRAAEARAKLNELSGAQAALAAPKAVPQLPELNVVRTTASGLQIIDEKIGNGPAPATGQTCVVHYTGWIYEDGKKKRKFDSSVDRGQPFEFPIGQRRVIAGWEEGVASMKVGGKRTLIIPPALGYGAGGAGGVIPPNATLAFDVELIAVK